jgi:hypothetical protein
MSKTKSVLEIVSEKLTNWWGFVIFFAVLIALICISAIADKVHHKPDEEDGPVI